MGEGGGGGIARLLRLSLEDIEISKRKLNYWAALSAISSSCKSSTSSVSPLRRLSNNPNPIPFNNNNL